ncbi:hypothetical protein [Acidipila rosea]|uniref:Uncharacterized protein n=1 Tax=Acidipila rosea TaxID=768535 RepID=A0A4R1LDR3_9BACT|nr:hypothetical protein [Acidipila rosea]TCK75877.1 hypothetical protein C7378_0876 [Acidipila rosea]
MFIRLSPEGFGASESLAQAGAAFHKTLHRAFDQWIASGKSGMDKTVEAPFDRSVSTVPAGYSQPLSDDLNDWLVRNGLPQSVDASGQRVNPEPFVDFRKLKGAPRLTGRDFALFWFLHFMESPFRYQLARCSNPDCGAYFAYGRKPRRLIKRGAYCANCKGNGAALRRDLSRSRKMSFLLDAAAKAWAEWKQSRQNPDRSEWVARQVNKRCRTEIRRRWVTQHIKEILERVEAQGDAKG